MGITRNKRVSNDELQAFFAEFESTTKVVDGALSYESMLSIGHLDEILPDAFSITPPLPRTSRIKIFSRALRAARLQGPLTEQSLIDHAMALLANHRENRERPYTLWTKIRGTMRGAKGFRVQWRGVTLSVAANLPRRLHVEPQENTGLGRIEPQSPQASAYAILSCKDRDEDDAVNRMLDCLQLIMSLINLYAARGHWTLMAAKPWAAGMIWLGPYQFVFQDEHFLGKSRTWYNPHFNESAWTRQEPTFADYGRHIRNLRFALAALEEHPLREVLCSALLLMQDGFETTDGNYRLLRFWAALEKIYVGEGNRGQSNQKVVDRAAFADIDYKISAWQLRHIADVRNEFVHSRGHDDDHMNLGQVLRELLTRHILHWIFHGQEFPTHRALLAYVDLPRSDADLLAMRNSIDRRLALNELQRKG